jgi:CRP/FNR family transcriptional regulator, cyclic AMP receptor protein
METTPIRDLLAGQRLFAGFDPAEIDLFAGCAKNQVYKTGAFLGREGESADTFFVLRAGRVAIELHAAGGPLVIEHLGPGEIIGWSWVIPPYRWNYDIEALQTAHVVSIDGTCLRAKCESEPAFGYRVLKRFAAVAVQRLEATSVRLLDIYGAADAT